MPNLDQFLKDDQASNLLKDTAKLEQLRNAPETQKIFSMLSESTGGDLERAAQDDPAQLISAIRKLMQNPESAALLHRMKEKMK